MNFKRINTNGITYIEPMQGTNQWYWGSDYCHGDLYEAEEIFQSNHRVKGNRLIFVQYPEGAVEEPIMKRDGQYFGRPVFDDGAIMVLLVDFLANKIKVIRYDVVSKELETIAVIEKSEIKDCYNLLLNVSPVYLSRDGNEGIHEILWPEKAEIQLEENESIFQREKDLLISTKWYEDSTYHEETLIRRYPTGEILDRLSGIMMEMPDQQKWIIG